MLDPLSIPPRGSRASRIGRSLLLAACCILIVACGSVPVPQPPAPSFAIPSRPDGSHAAAEASLRSRHGESASGFRLLERNEEALLWRLALIDTARHSLDMQYYVWFGDTVGVLMMRRLIDAADRGVRVRILFDDLNTMLHDMTHVELRDELLARIDSHPNIELRVFNAWHRRSLVGRALEFGADFQRLNRRMHNKQMIADNQATIIGGRNIGDEYFGLHGGFNFYDLDVLGIGPVARQASEVFDRYWNSRSVTEVRRLVDSPRDTEKPARSSPPPAVGDTPRQAPDPRFDRAAVARLLTATPLSESISVGRSSVHTDTPRRGADAKNHMPQAIRELLMSARREVLITNAYIIPGTDFIDDLRALNERGVRVRILTNSLASHDVPAVNSHYRQWRRPIVDTGTRLHELRADAALRSSNVDTAPTRSPFVGLHAKAIVIDRERALIGSMNLDPRSQLINTEMGVIVESPSLATDLAQRMERSMSPDNAWEVRAIGSSGVYWTSAAGVESIQPARDFWQRVEDVIFRFAPASLY